jgi:hypothetical protein
MSFFGRFKCKVNGHWKSVGSDMYQSLKETYRLDDGLHLKYCTRCHKVSLCVRETRERLWNPVLGAHTYNPLAVDEDDEVWVCVWEMS